MAEPKVRFKKADGMTYPSLQKAIMGDFYTERNERGNENLPVLTVSIHSGVSDGELDEDELGKRVKRSSDLTQYKKAVEGDLVFNMMRAWQGAVGSVKTTGMVSPAYIVAEPNSNIDPSFMDYYVQSKPVIDRFNRLSYGALDFRKRLYWDSFVTTEVNIPVIEEQQKIADFLSSVDEIITASEEEVANLETQKKAVMKKIFSQEVRFRKADGSDFPEWEYNPFEEIARLMTASIDPSKAGTMHCVELEHLEQGSGQRLGFIEAENQSSNKRLFETGDVLFGKLRPYLRKYWLATEDGCCSTEIWVLRPLSGVLSEYLLAIVSSDDFISVANTSEGTKMPRASWDLVANAEFPVPSFEEQRLIADFLSNFDEAIAAAKKELELWKELKKGLLQQMFV